MFIKLLVFFLSYLFLGASQTIEFVELLWLLLSVSEGHCFYSDSEVGKASVTCTVLCIRNDILIFTPTSFAIH